RYVAFYSWATNLVPGDTNGADDVFVRDRVTGATERVSADSAGTQGNGFSYSPSISGDGRYVAFYSWATNLVPGDTNGADDVFVRDRCPDGSCVGPPPSHRKVIFVQGINSGTSDSLVGGPFLCDGVRSHVRWIRDYLKTTAIGLRDSDFVYFDYAPNDPTRDKSCRDLIGSTGDCINCGAYTGSDTCRSIDDPASGGHGTAWSLDVLIKNLILEDPQVEIHLLAHSMGGLISSYWLARWGADHYPAPGGPLLREHIKSIMLFDSAPNGFSDWAKAFYYNPQTNCDFVGLRDAPHDLTSTVAGSVVATVRALTHVDGTPAMPKIYALDSYPGQAALGIPPCDAVEAQTGDVKNMHVGALPLESGSPFLIWGRTHGVVWADGWSNDPDNTSRDGIGLRQGRAFTRTESDTDHQTIQVAVASQLSSTVDVLLKCESNEIRSVSGTEVKLQSTVGEASGYLTLPLSDTADNRGLGPEERDKVKAIIACAVTGDPCGQLANVTLPAGGTSSYPAEVPTDASVLQVSASYSSTPPLLAAQAAVAALASGALEFHLVSPLTQTIILPTSTGDGLASFVVPNPEPGEWSIVLDGSATTSGTTVSLNIATLLQVAIDADQDNVADSSDNCPLIANLNQSDIDLDGIGDECDPDIDNDDVANATDNCPAIANSSQADVDADGLGHACDNDGDNDSVPDSSETNTGVFVNYTDTGTSPLNPDSDADGLNDGAELVAGTNPLVGDTDGDALLDGVDNCPLVANPDQLDTNGNGIGSVCEAQTAVGGIAEQPDVIALPSAAASPGRDYTLYILGGAVAFIVAAAGAAGWHKRRA
ncbi:MAG: thrombospondin type 3 repeat-containing protein, partial [Chloroflexi bacterium]|nr:thrombospondin type 3 repeat-containing protein [Chloroflexota bacterium]